METLLARLAPPSEVAALLVLLLVVVKVVVEEVVKVVVKAVVEEVGKRERLQTPPRRRSSSRSWALCHPRSAGRRGGTYPCY